MTKSQNFCIIRELVVINFNKMANEKVYSFWKGVKKSVVSVVLVGLPVVLTILPAEWQNLTIGGVLVLLVNWLKVKYSK